MNEKCWIVIRGKEILRNTLAITRKDSIYLFKKHWCDWEEGKKDGFKVVKCKIEILEK